MRRRPGALGFSSAVVAFELAVVLVSANAKPAYQRSRRARDNSRTTSPTASGPPSPAARTSRLPTITPSAISPTAAACSVVEMPNPTATGTSVAARMRSTSGSSPGGA